MHPGFHARVLLLLTLLLAWPLSPPSLAHAEAPLACGTAIPTGCEAWVAVHTGAGHWSPDVIASPDGTRAFVISRSQSGGEQAITAQAHDAETGLMLWNSSYAPKNFPTFRMAVASPDGARLHVVGHGGADSSILWQGFMLTYDARDGTILWSTKWDVDTEGYAVTTSPDGSRVFATGVSRGHNYVTLAFDAVTGQKLWQATYDNRGGNSGDWRGRSSDIPYAIAAAPEGTRVYVTGTSASATGLLEAATIAYDAATGAQRWVQRTHATDLLGVPSASEGYSIAAPVGGTVFTLGSYGVRAYDAETGTERWSQDGVGCRTYWPMASPGDCVLEVNPQSHRLFVATHHMLAAFDAHTGEEVWRLPLRVGENRFGAPGSMAMSPDGSRLFVATPGGRDPYVSDTNSAINANYETLAVDATTGRVVWRVSYDRGRDSASSIDATGERVFVTGESARTLPSDVATVAYDTNLDIQHVPPIPI